LREIFPLYFPIPEPTFCSSIEEFFVGELIFPDVIARDESTSLFVDALHEFLIYSIELMVLEAIAIGRIGNDDPLRYRTADIVTD
jgi:hypothetical protein